MRYVSVVLLFVGVILCAMTSLCMSSGDRDEVLRAAEQLRIAIVNVDIEGVERFAPENFMGSEYPGVYKDIGILLRDRKSRLHRKFFNRRNSVKQFFDEAQNLFINIEFDDSIGEMVEITYGSPEIDSVIWPKVTLEKKNGRWQFFDFFYNK